MMSEFSESYHLLTEDQHAGVALLERAGRAGWVFPPANGWCTVVVDGEFTGMPAGAVIAANEGVLLQYVNAEDHGWGFTVWNETAEISAYGIGWTEEIQADTSQLDLAKLREYLPVVRPGAWPAIEAGLEPPEDHATLFIGVENPGHRFARQLGLANFEWVSGHYLATGGEESVGPDVVRVDGAVARGPNLGQMLAALKEQGLLPAGAPEDQNRAPDLPVPPGVVDQMPAFGSPGDDGTITSRTMLTLAGVELPDTIAVYEVGLAAAGYEVVSSEVVHGRQVIVFRGRGFEGDSSLDQQGRRLQVVESSHRHP